MPHETVFEAPRKGLPDERRRLRNLCTGSTCREFQAGCGAAMVV